MFTSPDCDAQRFSLAKALAHGPVVLAFFPKAQTSGCTQEMEAFVSQAEQLAQHQAQVVAVSADSAETLKTFRDIVHAKFLFVPDVDGHLMKLFEAKMPLLTIAKRRTFVISRSGTIVHIAEGKEAVALTGIREALAALAPIKAHTTPVD
jgi:peroxiredoxin Q/BCP